MVAHGMFVWNELATPNPEQCKAFFADVLGWTSEDMPMLGAEGAATYTVFKAGDAMAGGMLKMEGPKWEGIPPHWLSYIEVDDVDAAVAKVPQAGGKVVVEPVDIPTVGRFCVITDPTGAAVALMTSASQG